MGEVLKRPRLRERYLVVVAGGAQAARSLTERDPRRRVAGGDLRHRGAGGRRRAARQRGRLAAARGGVAAVQHARRRGAAARGHARADARGARRSHLRPHAGVADRGDALYVSEDRRVDHAAQLPCRVSCPSLRRLSRPDAMHGSAATASPPPTLTRRPPRSTSPSASAARRLLRLFNVFNDEDLAGRARPGGGGPGSPARARHLPRRGSSATSTTGSPPRSSLKGHARAARSRDDPPPPGAARRRRTLERLEIHDARWSLPLAPQELSDALEGRRIERLGRRGKYLVWKLEDEAYLLLHLRMTGTLLLQPVRAPAAHARDLQPRRRQAGVRDPRGFGTGELALGDDAREEFFASRLGVEPFEPEFTGEHL